MPATQTDIRERVLDALVSFGAERDAIDDATLLRSLDIDSLDVAELAEILRDEFDIDIRAADFDDVKTVGEAFGLIYGRAGVS